MEFDLVRDSNEAPPKFERSRLFFFFEGYRQSGSLPSLDRRLELRRRVCDGPRCKFSRNCVFFLRSFSILLFKDIFFRSTAEENAVSVARGGKWVRDGGSAANQ